MAELTELSKLSRTITTHIDKIEKFIQDNNVPPTSFDVDSSLTLELNPDAAKSRDVVLDAMDQLQMLLLGPLSFLTRQASPSMSLVPSLHFIWRFKVAQNLGVEEIVSYYELAERCQVDSSDMRRILRSAIACYVFCEPENGFVRHNSVSRTLRDVPLFDDWVGMVCEENWMAAVQAVPAMVKWPKSQDIHHTGFKLMNQTEETFFEAIGSSHDRMLRFSNAMAFAHRAPNMSFSFLIDNLDWSEEYCPTSIVDIGGSQGAMGIELLRMFPKIQSCTVQDLPEVVRDAKTPKDLEGRLHFMAHNFFDQQTLHGQQAYLLRHILHDWPDKECITILKNIVPALRSGSRIYINETCLPDPGLLPVYRERYMRGYDVVMKYINNGKERDRGEWETLIAQVDQRLRIKRIVSPPGSKLSVIEIVWEP